MTSFKLDHAFEKGSFHLADGPLSQIRLMKDGEVTWFILVPQRAGPRELVDLNLKDQGLLMEEMNLCQNLLLEHTQCDKINIGALGNLTPQLHIHIIARFKNDRAWPGPIWGSDSNIEFDEACVSEWSERFKSVANTKSSH